MASEIRVNTINNRSGLGTISLTNTGVVVSGVITATSISVGGDAISGASGFAYDNTSNIFSCSVTALGSRTTGAHNFLAGTNAGCSITSGSYNNFLGAYAGQCNTTGN